VGVNACRSGSGRRGVVGINGNVVEGSEDCLAARRDADQVQPPARVHAAGVVAHGVGA